MHSKSQEYQFKTLWRIRGTRDEVYEILIRPLDYPKWWGLTHFSAREISPAGANGLGQTVQFEMKGWLPYTLQWELKSLEADKPYHIAGISTGDFDGLGVWTLKQDGQWVDTTFSWHVIAHKPFLRKWGFILKPLFSWNHVWVMTRAGRGLKELLNSRRIKKNV